MQTPSLEQQEKTLFLVVVGYTEIFRRFSTTKRNALFFSTDAALVIGVGWILGLGGNWPIGLPAAIVLSILACWAAISVLSAQNGSQVAGQAANGLEAVDLVLKLH